MRVIMAAIVICGLGLVGCQSAQQPVEVISTPQAPDAEMPLHQVLRLEPSYARSESPISIQLTYNSVDAPTAAQVKVLQTDRLDDSVNSIRSIYKFELQDGQWVLKNTETSYKCQRGPNTKKFQTALCI